MNERDETMEKLFSRVKRTPVEADLWPAVSAALPKTAARALPRWLPLLALFPAWRILEVAAGFPAIGPLKLLPIAAAATLFAVLKTNPFRIEVTPAGGER